MLLLISMFIVNVVGQTFKIPNALGEQNSRVMWVFANKTVVFGNGNTGIIKHSNGERHVLPNMFYDAQIIQLLYMFDQYSIQCSQQAGARFYVNGVYQKTLKSPCAGVTSLQNIIYILSDGNILRFLLDNLDSPSIDGALQGKSFVLLQSSFYAPNPADNKKLDVYSKIDMHYSHSINVGVAIDGLSVFNSSQIVVSTQELQDAIFIVP